MAGSCSCHCRNSLFFVLWHSRSSTCQVLRRPGFDNVCGAMRIILLIFLLTACAVPVQHEHVFKPVCRHQAVYAALVMSDHNYHVRIARGPAYDYGEWHAQAQAFIGGKWQPLCVSDQGIYLCDLNDWFEPMFYNSLADYFERQFEEVQR